MIFLLLAGAIIINVPMLYNLFENYALSIIWMHRFLKIWFRIIMFHLQTLKLTKHNKLIISLFTFDGA
jgi:hypothetical protein